MILGDIGANVIKVERPGRGDDTRGWGPPFDTDGQSAYFLSINRNKLSIALDLDAAPDRDVLHDLIEGADVVLDNFLPGVLSRRGLDPTTLLSRHPGLIWCTISGFGEESTRPGYDFVVQAESGWMSITGEPEGTPMKTGVALADVMAGKDAAIAILAALVRREASGDQPLPLSARRLNVSLIHSAVSSLVNVAQNVLVSGRPAARWGNAHPNLVPYQLFQAADRHLVVAVGSDDQWHACCAALALHDLAADSTLSTNAGRIGNRDRVVAAIGARLRERAAAEWITALSASGVPCGLVRSVSEALGGADANQKTGVAPMTQGTVRRPPPGLDEHGALVRASGWNAFSRPG